MKRNSVSFTEAHFNAKAKRYQNALCAVPHARDLEFLPFLLLLGCHLDRDPRRLVAADLLCGSGVLTNSLRGCFRKIVGIDVSQGMLSSYPVGVGVTAVHAALDEHTDLLTNRIKPDVIMALAGLHHVYLMEDGHISDEASDKLQASVMLGWARSLPPHGVMIIADVTSPDVAVTFSENTTACPQAQEIISTRFSELSHGLGASIQGPSFFPNGLPSSVKDYVDTIAKYTNCGMEANPGAWFREVVASRGLYGHVDHFLRPGNLIESLRREGYKVEYHELPTAWIFPSMEDFLFFFYEKFVFGPERSEGEEIQDLIQKHIPELPDLVQRYLGIQEIEQGKIGIGWRLGYYVVKSCAG